MHVVLGLSLSSDDVVWVLVNAADRTIVDHDALEFPAGDEVAGAAASGACAIAAGVGLEVDRVRLTWSDDAKHDGFRLLTRLRLRGFEHVDAVPLESVLTVSVDAQYSDMAPRLALAYGAALAEVGLADAVTVPVAQQIPARRITRYLVASAVVGTAAAAVLGVLFLTAGSVPQVEPAATTAEQTGPSDPGWVSVTPPSNAAANFERKVVATPSSAEEPAAEPLQTYYPVEAVVAAAPAPAAAPPLPEPDAAPGPPGALTLPGPVEAMPLPVETAAVAPAEPVAVPQVPVEQAHLQDGQEHLPGVQAVAAPAAEAAPPALPAADMTLPPNVLTALP